MVQYMTYTGQSVSQLVNNFIQNIDAIIYQARGRYHSPKEGTTHVAVALFFMKYAFVNTNCHFRTESLTTRQILRDAQELKYLKD